MYTLINFYSIVRTERWEQMELFNKGGIKYVSDVVKTRLLLMSDARFNYLDPNTKKCGSMNYCMAGEKAFSNVINTLMYVTSIR